MRSHRAICRFLASLGCIFGLLHLELKLRPTGSKDNLAGKVAKRSSSHENGMVRSSMGEPYIQTRLWDQDKQAIVFSSSEAPIQDRRRLELVHVPKTGGSTLEALAASHDVRWGTCHYLPRLLVPGGRDCPPLATKNQSYPPPHHPVIGASYWHIPLPFMQDNPPSWTQGKTTDFFMVVRNPYTRVISEWNYYNTGTPVQRFNATWMNAELTRILQTVDQAGSIRDETTGLPTQIRKYCLRDCHYIPQSDHLVPNMHVLRQEHLAEDFEQLARKFHLNWTFPTVPTNKAHRSTGVLTVGDLTLNTRQWILKVYAKDFQLFDYSTEPPL